jgi:hypothetical protein
MLATGIFDPLNPDKEIIPSSQGRRPCFQLFLWPNPYKFN